MTWPASTAALFVPGLGKIPEGHRTLAEAYHNQGLPYEERADLLLQGKGELAEDISQNYKWTVGQGLVLGGAAGMGTLVGANNLEKLLREAAKWRRGQRTAALQAALGVAAAEDPSVVQRFVSEVSSRTGIKSRGRMNIGDFVSGPLNASLGNEEKALRAAGEIFGDAVRSRPIFGPGSDSRIFNGWRAAARPEHGIADRLLSASSRFASRLRGGLASPYARTALIGGAAGLGGILGAVAAARNLEEVQEDIPTREEAVSMLRQADRIRARRLAAPDPKIPMLPSIGRGVEGIAGSLKETPERHQIIGNLTSIIDAAESPILSQGYETAVARMGG